jgi:hypothetical protein
VKEVPSLTPSVPKAEEPMLFSSLSSSGFSEVFFHLSGAPAVSPCG